MQPCHWKRKYRTWYALTEKWEWRAKPIGGFDAHTWTEHQTISITTESNECIMLACRPYVCRRTHYSAQCSVAHITIEREIYTSLLEIEFFTNTSSEKCQFQQTTLLLMFEASTVYRNASKLVGFRHSSFVLEEFHANTAFSFILSVYWCEMQCDQIAFCISSHRE